MGSWHGNVSGTDIPLKLHEFLSHWPAMYDLAFIFVWSQYKLIFTACKLKLSNSTLLHFPNSVRTFGHSKGG